MANLFKHFISIFSKLASTKMATRRSSELWPDKCIVFHHYCEKQVNYRKDQKQENDLFPSSSCVIKQWKKLWQTFSFHRYTEDTSRKLEYSQKGLKKYDYLKAFSGFNLQVQNISSATGHPYCTICEKSGGLVLILHSIALIECC